MHNSLTGPAIVTGCAGFIGFHLTRHLLERGRCVLGIDEVNDAYDPGFKLWRLEELSRFPQFEFAQLDVADGPQLRDCAESWSQKSGGLAVLFHLAGRAGVRQSVAQPDLYLRANVGGTLCTLEACRDLGIKKFVLASSSSLYAGATTFPFCETDDTSRPLSPYAASKKAAEVMAHSFHHIFGLDVSVVRFFTVYGPWGRPDMSVLQFMRGIATGQPITVYGDGSQERDFTYVDDIVSGVTAAATDVGFDVFNLGGNSLHSINALIEMLAREFGKQPLIDFQPVHKADVAKTFASIDHARQRLGWEPKVDFPEGIQRTANWFRVNSARILQLSF